MGVIPIKKGEKSSKEVWGKRANGSKFCRRNKEELTSFT